MRRPPHVIGALAALSFLLALGAPTSVAAPDTQKELTEAQARLERLQREFRAARKNVYRVRGELQTLIAQVSEVTAQKEALQEAIEEARAEMSSSKVAAAELQADLNARAREMYIRGPAGTVELILQADSLVDLSDRASYLEILSEADANVATGLRTERQQISGLTDTLAEYRADVNRLLESLQGKEAEVEAKFAEAEAAQAVLDDKIQAAEKAVETLKKKVQREYLQRYGITGGGTVGPPVKADGPLYWCPVDPPRSYIDTFGAPRSGGRTHQGNDIFAPPGTPIRAPFAGRAEEGSNSLGGYTVNVYASASGDYVYNAHMSRYAGVDGQQVEAGDIIGFVGNTGNALGTPPHDHFEYHPGGGSAVTPYLYLNEVCGVNGGA